MKMKMKIKEVMISLLLINLKKQFEYCYNNFLKYWKKYYDLIKNKDEIIIYLE